MNTSKALLLYLKEEMSLDLLLDVIRDNENADESDLTEITKIENCKPIYEIVSQDDDPGDASTARFSTMQKAEAALKNADPHTYAIRMNYINSQRTQLCYEIVMDWNGRIVQRRTANLFVDFKEHNYESYMHLTDNELNDYVFHIESLFILSTISTEHAISVGNEVRHRCLRHTTHNHI